jgi:hypothetical protein
MKPSIVFNSLLVLITLWASNVNANTNLPTPVRTVSATNEENSKIQVALLIDTSNSMDGLIEQAKSRLWNIVNTLTTLKNHGKTPDIEIGLYEYGNDGLSVESNYIRLVAPLTTDLDLISEKLFSLRTNGGSEYCGAVIQDATKKMHWSKEKNNMKLIYICGNEDFNQGAISYKESIKDAFKNDIYVNTIFCGNQAEGVNLLWKSGADTGNGKYFNIDSDKVVQYIVTPFDDSISKCNQKINSTYISYGSRGSEKKQNQMMQDSNAQGVSSANYTERAVSKSKAAYKNGSWDLVDKMKEDAESISKVKKEELPLEFQNKSSEELKTIVSEKLRERERIQKEIGDLAKKRQSFLDNEAKKTNSVDDLGNAITTSILSFAKEKGYSIE